MSHDDGVLARRVFDGLAPTAPVAVDRTPLTTAALARSMRSTVPYVLVGTMTVTMGLTGPIDRAEAKERDAGRDRGSQTPPTTTIAAVAVVERADIPATHTVRTGETVASIADEYGLSTAHLLARNGLGWKSLIFPGQVLKLRSSSASSAAQSFATVARGDTVSRIAERHGVSVRSILTANGLTWSSVIYPGQRLSIPSSSVAAAPEAPSELEIAQVSSVTSTAARVELSVEERRAERAERRARREARQAERAATTYRVVAGDTLSGIASRAGISTQSLLDANSLSWSSVIYPGMRLTIPGGSVSTDSGSTSSGGSDASITALSDSQAEYARIIIAVGQELGVSRKGIVIALATAMQESSLRNIDWGDRDSVGLFQQRPSSGWGTKTQLLDPAHAARLFYGGPSNPNAGRTRGLLDISGWRSMSVADAAQAVQISAHPDAYAKWESSAKAWYRQLA